MFFIPSGSSGLLLEGITKNYFFISTRFHHLPVSLSRAQFTTLSPSNLSLLSPLHQTHHIDQEPNSPRVRLVLPSQSAGRSISAVGSSHGGWVACHRGSLVGVAGHLLSWLSCGFSEWLGRWYG